MASSIRLDRLNIAAKAATGQNWRHPAQEPPLADRAMRGLAETAAKYRWEILLFLGLPFLADAAAFEVLTIPLRIVLLVLSITGLLIPVPSIESFGAFSLHVHAFLLGIIYYFYIRRSGRRTLSLVWAYAFTATVIGAVAAWAPELDSTWQWLVPAAEAMAGGVALLWLAARASRFSFGHAFLLVFLSTALHSHWTVAVYFSVPWTESNPAYWLVSLLAIAQGLLAVRVFARFDSARVISKNAIIALFALEAAMIIILEFAGDGHPATEAALSSLLMLASWAAWYGAVILLTYLARSREPFDPGPDEPTTPPPWGPLGRS